MDVDASQTSEAKRRIAEAGARIEEIGRRIDQARAEGQGTALFETMLRTYQSIAAEWRLTLRLLEPGDPGDAPPEGRSTD